MNDLKSFLRKIIDIVPGARPFVNGMRRIVGGTPKADFSGWGMITTMTYPPWHNGGGDEVAKDFLRTNQKIVADVNLGKFILSQFDDKGIRDKTPILSELMWRHYIVFWSARYASRATTCPVKNLVECGVCDGLTMYFAMNAVEKKYEFTAFLYDAWADMKTDHLLESEHGHRGAYGYLDIETTRNNLADFRRKTVFIKGYIPESFDGPDNPTELVWLHIDLNSSLPTTAALEFFFDKVSPGGVVLFDDYAWHAYETTKSAVDAFFSQKRGVLLPLPTGQAIYFAL